MAFSTENLKILVTSREIHAFIQTATYPLFTKGTWKNEDLLADLVEFFCSGSAVQRSLWARLEKRVHVSEAERKRRRTEAANAVTPLSVVDLVLLLKIPRRRYYCARFACDIARTSAHSTRFVDFCARYILMLRYFPQVQRFNYLDEK